MSHEDLTRRTASRTSSDRAFGFVFVAVFAAIAVYPVLFGAPPRGWSLAVAGCFAVLASAAPGMLAPLNRAWTRFGLLLHAIVSPVMLGIMFYGVVMPTGLAMRLARKDPLRLRFEPGAGTYWIERAPPGPPPESFRDQF